MHVLSSVDGLPVWVTAKVDADGEVEISTVVVLPEDLPDDVLEQIRSDARVEAAEKAAEEAERDRAMAEDRADDRRLFS